MKEKTIEELLDELQNVVDALKASLPKEVPLFFSKSIDSVRALHLREACLYRVAELSDAACNEFKKNNLVAGYLLARAVLETLALFEFFLDEVTDSIKVGDIKKVREILTRMTVGARVKLAKENVVKALGKTVEEMGKTLDPIQVPKLIEHMAKKLPPFAHHYEFLCEVAHPNATGLIKAYVKNDWERGVTYFGKEQGSFGSHLQLDLGAIISLLEMFIVSYNKSAKLLERFQGLCEDKVEIAEE